jgi:hypothetical protein
VGRKQQVENLKVELELEKNRHYKPEKVEQPKDNKPKRTGLGNIIRWVSKDEREKDADLYGFLSSDNSESFPSSAIVIDS